jgi:hypothetical protein
VRRRALAAHRSSFALEPFPSLEATPHTALTSRSPIAAPPAQTSGTKRPGTLQRSRSRPKGHLAVGKVRRLLPSDRNPWREGRSGLWSGPTQELTARQRGRREGNTAALEDLKFAARLTVGVQLKGAPTRSLGSARGGDSVEEVAARDNPPRFSRKTVGAAGDRKRRRAVGRMRLSRIAGF